MHLRDFILEKLSASQEEKLVKKVDELEKKADKQEEKIEDQEDEIEKQEKDLDKEKNKAEESIKDEKGFREAAEAKFKAVFGDKLDTDKMKETVDGILKDNKEDVEKGDWGKLIGILNKSFGGR